MFDFVIAPQQVRESEEKNYINPIFTAKKYAAMIESRVVVSEAELARKLCLSRARVNQLMMLLKLDRSVLDIVEGFG